MAIYGPYKRKDGRKHIIIIENGIRRTVSYPKYLMEEHLGRRLANDETVDHIDGDFTNNDLSNLQILTRADNIKKSSKGLAMRNAVCSFCGKVFSRRKAYIDRNERLGRLSFCSKGCVGKVYH